MWAEHAKHIKAKVLRYARAFQFHGEDSAAIYFYENEAASLIKLLSFFIAVSMKPEEDYYAQIVNRRTEKTDISEEKV